MKPGISLHARLLLAASLVLAAFLGLTGLSLDKAFRSSAEKALKARLQSNIYALLAAAKEDQEGRLILPEMLTDPRFNRPDSGLYAEVKSTQARYSWRSSSMVGRSFTPLHPVSPGESHHQVIASSSYDELMTLSYGIIWEDYAGKELTYTLAVAEDLQPHLEQIAVFRDSLFFWLGGAALVLLLAQGGVLRWGLKPLRTVASELKAIESGRSDQLFGEYPRELVGLTRNLNSLIRHTQSRQQRFRDSLSDLAHSLKTPLAILQNLADQQGLEDADRQKTLTEQVSRMNQIVGHQLQRAAASGSSALTQSIFLEPLVERIAGSLNKVYSEKQMKWEIDMPETVEFQGDEGDLMEVLGNLMENAWKYGNSRVRISSHEHEHHLELHVEDDGKGIPKDRAHEVLQRGHRVDEQLPGQGIGLSVAVDILKAYGGELAIHPSELGGADVKVILPMA